MGSLFRYFFGLCIVFPTTETLSAEELYPQVSQILAQHCLECHGPDATQRQAELRLDLRSHAIGRLKSGTTAVVPGDPDRSELLRRITAVDASQMPPADSGRRLRPAEVELLRNWIRNGAKWPVHWSLQPLIDRPPPEVGNSEWVREPIDRFILSRLRQSAAATEIAAPAPSVLSAAERGVLLRRVFFDLIGLPPTPRQVRDFVSDQSPDAWQKVIDGLLASPLYGQRWGRHWLDVVRYGDSNGSDENHDYPYAWRYRNYIIDAFNNDLPFDQFVREQLAGDLLTDTGRKNEALTATGFLAIGTKILAEKDPAKKQADIVDEQIDTIGRALLGFSVACARCHDHKFDPIPTKDYYSLAGILHSSAIVDSALQTDDFQQAMREHNRRLAELDVRRQQLEDTIGKSRAAVIDREAESFDRGSAVKVATGYGEGIGIISDNMGQSAFAEWDFDITRPGKYVLQFRYAAAQQRPGPLTINGTVVRQDAVNGTTGGWHPPQQQWQTEGQFVLRTGRNTVRFESSPCMSHIDRIRLIRADRGELPQILAQLDNIERERKSLLEATPQPGKVMAVQDSMPKNVRVHIRGSHLDPGEEVPRGFPGIAMSGSLRPKPFPIAESMSGRLQLANWATDPEHGAGRQVARVLVNRVWQWHFGRGIVESPDDYGLRGSRPDHRALLDWLTLQFIRNNWSVKSLHRLILNSAAWRQQSVATQSPLFVGFTRRRLEAEVIRDTLLFHAGRLDVTPATRIPGVTAQNPSPDDLKRNENVHRESDKRSVYLPVVRSNTYRFFSLFDFPNATTSVGRRTSTTVPTQALLLMNDPFLLDQADRFSARVRENVESAGVVDAIYQRLFQRMPTDGERAAAAEFIRRYAATRRPSDSVALPTQKQSSDGTPEADAWSAYCHTLMTSSEFLYVE